LSFQSGSAGRKIVAPLKPVISIATEDDKKHAEDNKKKKKKHSIYV
jgi:cell fate regulator YaaT (PSP1 superfamily)